MLPHTAAAVIMHRPASGFVMISYRLTFVKDFFYRVKTLYLQHFRVFPLPEFVHENVKFSPLYPLFINGIFCLVGL